MVRMKVKTNASTWWTERSKILAETKKVKPAHTKSKSRKAKITKHKRAAAKKPVKARKVKKVIRKVTHKKIHTAHKLKKAKKTTAKKVVRKSTKAIKTTKGKKARK